MKPLPPLALVCNDSRTLALQLCQQLEALGLNTDIAGSEAEVFAKAEASELIFIELQFSGSNGFQITRQLSGRCNCPLVLVTGTGRSSDLHWALQAGAATVLTRPVLSSALQLLLQQLQVVLLPLAARSDV